MITFKQWLLEKSTIQQLDMKARAAFPNTKKRQNDIGSVTVLPNIFYTPDTGKGELTISSHTKSSSGNAHAQRIMLYHVSFVQPGDATAKPLGNTGSAVQPIALNKDTARVACDCMDFRFRFADTDHKDDSLAGDAPPAYQPVPGSNRPPANPSGLPGMCKHIMAVVQNLKQSGIVR